VPPTDWHTPARGWNSGKGMVAFPAAGMFPIFPAKFSVNQTWLPRDATPRGPAACVVTGKSLTPPASVIRPSAFRLSSANHNAPSGPTAMALANGRAPGIGNSVITPEVVIRPTFAASLSVNQSAPSGPSAMPCGPLLEVGIAYSVMVNGDDNEMRPIWLASRSVNHIALSGPAAMNSA